MLAAAVVAGAAVGRVEAAGEVNRSDLQGHNTSELVSRLLLLHPR